jgi:CSLREA domain-containing protein
MKVLRLLPVVILTVFLVAGLFLVLHVSAAPVTAMVVDTLDDELNNDGDCSLRDAITAANENTPIDFCPAGDGVLTDTISFEMSGTILLTEQLSVTEGGPLVIDGGNAITVSGNTSVRALYVESGAHLTLENTSITEGFADKSNGGGIWNGGILKILNSILASNEADDDDLWFGLGGGIYKVGELYVNNSLFTDNGSLAGGAIYNDDSGLIYIVESEVSSNGPTDFGPGGGIYNKGTLTITRSVVNDNDALFFGGGGIFNLGTLYIENSTISGNSSDLDEIDSHGGGINNVGSGTFYIINSTISGNSAEQGGGIRTSNAYGTHYITNSTISGNNAGYGGGIYTSFGTVTLYNTIVAENPIGGNCYWGSGMINDGGHNIEDGNTCSFSPANDSMPNTDPVLGPLQDNGGPTWTRALLPGSPAIDAANPVYCPTNDQRGVLRPMDGDNDGNTVCDIGSYEYEHEGILYPTTTTITGDDPDHSLPGQPFTVDFDVTTSIGVLGGTVIVTVSDITQSCTDTLMNGMGSCSLSIAETGVHTLTATYGGDAFFAPSNDSESHTVGQQVFVPIITRHYPALVDVEWSTIYEDIAGNYYLGGSVVNQSGVTVYSVEITARLYNENGYLMGVYTGETALAAPLTGMNNPFDIYVGSEAPQSYKLELDWSVVSPVGSEYRPVTVISQEVIDHCPFVTIQGEIHNDQTETLQGIEVIVLPGDDGIYNYAVVGADILVPGGTTEYTDQQYYPSGICPAFYSVLGQGYLEP